MATKLQTLAITLACITILLSASEAQKCKVNTGALITCYPCIKNNNPDRYPSTACCKALENADLPCLCSYRNSPSVRRLGINPDRAVKLPQECGLTVPAGCQ